MNLSSVVICEFKQSGIQFCILGDIPNNFNFGIKTSNMEPTSIYIFKSCVFFALFFFGGGREQLIADIGDERKLTRNGLQFHQPQRHELLNTSKK